jgi:hypothetical protein
MSACCCRDGNLITGQNPGSSKGVAQEVIAALSPPISSPMHGKGEGEGFHHRQVTMPAQGHFTLHYKHLTSTEPTGLMGRLSLSC